MTFKDQLVVDATTVFLNTDEFAELVTYYPGGNLLAGVSLKAIVEREEQNPHPNMITERGPQRRVTLVIANHATLGRTSISRGVDRVAVPIRVGEAPTVCLVVGSTGSDGMWRLEVIA